MKLAVREASDSLPSCYPSTPVGGPIEAKRPRLQTEIELPYPSTPVGGPIEAISCETSGTEVTPIRRLRSAAPLKHDPSSLVIGPRPFYPSTPVGGPIEAAIGSHDGAPPPRLSVDSGRRPH